MIAFHELYKHKMEKILHPIVKSADDDSMSLAHYYYTSPSVQSDAIPIVSLQTAFKRHRQSIDLNKINYPKTKIKKRKIKKREIKKPRIVPPESPPIATNIFRKTDRV